MWSLTVYTSVPHRLNIHRAQQAAESIQLRSWPGIWHVHCTINGYIQDRKIYLALLTQVQISVLRQALYLLHQTPPQTSTPTPIIGWLLPLTVSLELPHVPQVMHIHKARTSTHRNPWLSRHGEVTLYTQWLATIDTEWALHTH